MLLLSVCLGRKPRGEMAESDAAADTDKAESADKKAKGCVAVSGEAALGSIVLPFFIVNVVILSVICRERKL